MNMMTFWLLALLALLAFEFLRMDLYGACAAIGAIGAIIVCAFDLHLIIQLAVFVVITMLLVLFVRPIGFKYIHRMKKDSDMQNLVGKDAIVISKIDNEQGVGLVLIDGRQWSAKSHRPNAVIPAGTLTKVVVMRGDVAIVDDMKRNNR